MLSPIGSPWLQGVLSSSQGILDLIGDTVLSHHDHLVPHGALLTGHMC